MGDQAPIITESCFTTVLHISEPGDEDYGLQHQALPQIKTSAAEEEEVEEEVGDVVDRLVVPDMPILSTNSPASHKTGKQQLIPKNLAVSSRPKNRHHTTVVTFPVGLELSKSGNESKSRLSAVGPEVGWDEYDSDGDGFGFRRNRRNKSYKAAVTEVGFISKGSANMLAPRTLGRKRNQKQRGSFKDRLYQDVRERGLHSTNQDELLDDFVVVEHPVEEERDQGIVVRNYRPAQLTWSQLPQVKETGILSLITPQERKRQEAIFEIITSEHSYLHSLGILVRHFKNSEALRKTMTATEHHHLFSNISVIEDVSKFFEDLEKRHYDNPVIRDISDIVQNHAAHHFEPYIVYCSNETFQQRTLQKLSNNTGFKDALKQIESSTECGGLPMISFLILPMQRVTRLPLLLDTICQKTPDKTAEYFAALWAFHAMSKQLVTSCNERARQMERTEQMYTIQKQMDFGKIK
uniref:DH domain-containing protein n=1 Tax=Periophthalmus magnuspinnatus TaxID=409849 RepID=A0A3B4B170_9GOBI